MPLPIFTQYYSPIWYEDNNSDSDDEADPTNMSDDEINNTHIENDNTTNSTSHNTDTGDKSDINPINEENSNDETTKIITPAHPITNNSNYNSNTSYNLQNVAVTLHKLPHGVYHNLYNPDTSDSLQDDTMYLHNVAPLTTHRNFVIHQPKVGTCEQLRAGDIVAQADDNNVWTKVQLILYHKDTRQQYYSRLWNWIMVDYPHKALSGYFIWGHDWTVLIGDDWNLDVNTINFIFEMWTLPVPDKKRE